MTVIHTELDALLDRVREDRQDTTGKNRLAVAFDCWRMFEDLAMRYKEEFAMRDRSAEVPISDRQLRSLWASRNSKRAQHTGGKRAGAGRKPRPTPCPICAVECPSAKEAKAHCKATSPAP